MIDITFEFATMDDCLDRMVPSDLRKLVAERDTLKLESDELNKACEEALEHDFHSDCGIMNIIRAMRMFNTPEAIAQGKLAGKVWAVGK